MLINMAILSYISYKYTYVEGSSDGIVMRRLSEFGNGKSIIHHGIQAELRKCILETMKYHSYIVPCPAVEENPTIIDENPSPAHGNTNTAFVE